MSAANGNPSDEVFLAAGAGFSTSHFQDFF
jgi:hypothetical protein